MDPQQQFCLKWNSYSSNLAMTFSNLFKSELLADVTLFCGGKLSIYQAYKGLKFFFFHLTRIVRMDMIFYHHPFISYSIKNHFMSRQSISNRVFIFYLCAKQFSLGLVVSIRIVYGQKCIVKVYRVYAF